MKGDGPVLAMEYRKYAPAAVRYGVGIVFLILGIMQLVDPAGWIGYVPGFVPGDARTIILLNGVLDSLVGLALLIGFYVRIAAIIGALHLLGITFSLGWNDLAVRDFGLALATLSVALHAEDDWCARRPSKR